MHMQLKSIEKSLQKCGDVVITLFIYSINIFYLSLKIKDNIHHHHERLGRLLATLHRHHVDVQQGSICMAHDVLCILINCSPTRARKAATDNKRIL